MKKWKLGIVSATGFAKNRHMPSYAKMDNVEMAACCDMNAQALEETCDQYGIPGRYTDLDEMLKDDSLEIISVVVRPQWHIPTARKCVEAGKHVLVEKPLSEDYREMLEFRDFLSGRDEKVMVSQNYRFQNPALEMKDVIDAGELGEPYRLEVVKYNSSGPTPRDPERYKGLFVNIGVHDVDMIRYLIGREVEAVWAEPLAAPHTREVTYPFAEIGMFFEGGATASARMDWTTQGLERWTDVRCQGTKAVAYCDYTVSPDILVASPEGEKRFHRDEECDDIRKVMNHFIERISRGEQPDTWVGDNIKTMEIVLAAYLSCREKRVVNFPEDRKLLETV